jgi:hypothetical protein
MIGRTLAHLTWTGSSFAIATLLVAGCGSGGSAPTPATSFTQPPPGPSRSCLTLNGQCIETSTPTGITLSIQCSGTTYSDVARATLESIWSSKSDFCEGTVTSGTPDQTDQKALHIAYGGTADEKSDSLGTLYGMCAQTGAAAWSPVSSPTAAQAAEIKGMLIICPNHPDRALLNKYISAGTRRDQLERQGRIFGSGVYLVNKQIKPGTYVASDPSSGCYWERTDRNGKIIDNYFTNGAARVQVTIRSTDYSFNSKSCGEWSPVS